MGYFSMTEIEEYNEQDYKTWLDHKLWRQREAFCVFMSLPPQSSEYFFQELLLSDE